METLGTNGMMWGLFAVTMMIWFAAIYFIIKGLSGPGEVREVHMEGVTLSGIDQIRPEVIKETAVPVIEIPRREEAVTPIARPAPMPKQEEEIEIPIGEPLREEKPAPAPISAEDFFKRFGKSNIVEFPAEYVDERTVRDVSGKSIGIVEFAKNCYREIGFQCLEVIAKKEAGQRTLVVNVFDLLSSHYAHTDEDFIGYFGELREALDSSIKSLASHPEITLRNQRALAGKYEGVPQLLAWNERELFFVLVKAKSEGLRREEIDFLNEYVLEKGLLKARIFKVTAKIGRQIRPAPEEKREEPPVYLKAEGPQTAEPGIAIERFGQPITKPQPVPEPIAKAKIPPVPPMGRMPSKEPKRGINKKPFTPGEIQFLAENSSRMTNEELARHLGRSLDSVTHKMSRLMIARESYEWTEDKDDFLRVNLTRMSYRELAEQLGTTIPSVRARCKKIQIKK